MYSYLPTTERAPYLLRVLKVSSADISHL